MSLDRKEICVSLPLALVAEVDLELHDPETGKPQYGARSALIASLLEEHLLKKRLERNASANASAAQGE